MEKPDVWLRGPVPEVVPALQPVAHSLMQVKEDLLPLLDDLDPTILWDRPGRSGAIGYHAIHLAGALDRLFTYARNEPLTENQRTALDLERNAHAAQLSLEVIRQLVADAIDAALQELTTTSTDGLTDVRKVGGDKLPATTLGVLFHAAEHSTRHAGQIVTLVRVVGPS